MYRDKKPEHDFKPKMAVTYVCPKTGNYTSKEFDSYDIETNDSPCELCGSHGNMSIDISGCPECGQSHEIPLRSW